MDVEKHIIDGVIEKLTLCQKYRLYKMLSEDLSEEDVVKKLLTTQNARGLKKMIVTPEDIQTG